MPRIRVVLMLLLVSCVAVAQEITLVGPVSPVSVGCSVEVNALGLKDGEIYKATILVTPEVGVVRIRRAVIEGQQAVIVDFNRPNKYLVSVGFNVQHTEWRKSANVTHRLMLEAGLTSDPLTVLQKKIIDESAIKFPTRGGSCVVEVIAEEPETPPPPPPGPTDFENAVKDETAKAIRSGGTTATALAISDVFGNTANSVESGMTPFENGNALKVAGKSTEKVFSTRPDEKSWAEFRKNLSEAFDTLRQNGEFSTKEGLVEVFREISRGMSRAVNE